MVICNVVVLQSEDIWFNAPRKGVLVFALPGERCVADISGDFKILFSDRHGDFYWCVRGPRALRILLDGLRVGCKWLTRFRNSDILTRADAVLRPCTRVVAMIGFLALSFGSGSVDGRM